MKRNNNIQSQSLEESEQTQGVASRMDSSAPAPLPDVSKVAKARVQDTEKWVDVYRFRRVGGGIGFAAIAASMASCPKEVLSKLADFGLDGTTHLRVRDIISKAAHTNPIRMGTILLRGGWIGAPGRVFALPSQIVRGRHESDPNHEYFLAPGFDLKQRAQPVFRSGKPASTHLPLGRKGSRKKWAEKIAKPALHSSAMMLGISASIAAPFLRLLNEPPFGILITGPSSGGKTTLTLASGSFNGVGKESDLANWNSTAAGIAQEVEIHSDLCFQIDDIKNFSGSDREIFKLMAEVAYRITHGMRKVAHREAVQRITGRPAVRQGVSTILLTSAEMTLDQLAKSAGERSLPEGAGVRLVEVPILPREKGGIFDLLPPQGTHERQTERRATLAAEIVQRCEANHGWPLVKLLEAVVADPASAVAAVKRYRESFMAEADFDRKDSYQRRHAQRFAFLFATSSYAIDKNILPWSNDQLRNAILKCHRSSRAVIDARKATRTTPTDTLGDGLRRLKKLIKSPGQFSDVSHPKTSTESAGWKESKKGRRIFYIRGSVWRDDIFGSRAQRLEVERRLIQHGQLHAGAKGPVTVQLRLGTSGKRTERCYQLTFRKKENGKSNKRTSPKAR